MRLAVFCEAEADFRTAAGLIDPMREAWVLAGFDPETDDERARLDDLRRELGFHPSEAAHRLGVKDEQAKRSAKRVLSALTGGDGEREARCWRVTILDRLRARGEHTGVRAFLADVEIRLVPLC